MCFGENGAAKGKGSAMWGEDGVAVWSENWGRWH